MALLPALLLLLSAGRVWCFSAGPPIIAGGVATDVCTTLVPTSNAPHRLQSGTGGFSIYVDSDLGIVITAAGLLYNYAIDVTYNRK